MSSVSQNESPDREFLVDMARMKMPFGRYAGRYLVDLPEPYVIWFKQKGFPRGRLGKMFEVLFEIKVNGLEYLLRNLQDHDEKIKTN
ncbi:DUF3820 family protein [bacterium]|nr:DUF3820 family protein [bacterium]